MPSLFDEATAPYTGQQPTPDSSSLWGWLSSLFQNGQSQPLDQRGLLAQAMLQPPAGNSLFPPAPAGGPQYLSQGPAGPIPVSQIIDPSLTFQPGTGAHEAYQQNLERAANIALSFGPGALESGRLPGRVAPPPDAGPAGLLTAPNAPPMRFSSAGTAGNNPLPIPAETETRLARKLSRDPDSTVGAPKNDQPIQLPNGDFIGPVSTDQWIARNEKYLTPGGVDQAATWYRDALPAYKQYFGEDKGPAMMGAWLIGNQNATPGFAQLSATRALEQYVNRTRGMPESLQAGLPAEELNKYWDAVLSNDPSKFANLSTGQKIYDFIDSAVGKNTRTFYGDDPRAGAPAVADVHTTRDTGFIDPRLHNWVRQTYGDDVANGITPDAIASSPSETQYEWSADRMRSITDDLNQRNYRGRSDWTPAEAQAVGWKAMSTMTGRPGQTAESAILSTARNLSYELDFGQGAPWNQTFPEWSTLTPQEKATVSGPVVDKAMDFAKDVTGAQENWRLAGTGAWHADLNPAFKSQFLSSPEVVNDVLNILGHQLQQTEIYGSRLFPSGKQWALAVHGDGLDDPGNLDALWGKVQQTHPDLAEGFSPALDENGVPGIHIFYKGGGKTLGNRIENELVPAIDASAQNLGITTDTRLLRGETVSSVNDWSADADGGQHTQRLSTRYGPSIQQRLDDHAKTEIEPLIRKGIDDVLAARTANPAQAPPAAGTPTLVPGGALNPNSPGTPPGLLSY